MNRERKREYTEETRRVRAGGRGGDGETRRARGRGQEAEETPAGPHVQYVLLLLTYSITAEQSSGS